jgi:hypothetical protein
MYGICTDCNKSFATVHKFNEHPCMVSAMHMSRKELAERLFRKGKMSEEEYRKVLVEETP